MPGLAFDQGSSRVVQFDGGRGTTAQKVLDLAAEVRKGFGQAIGLEGGGDRERSGAAAGVELTWETGDAEALPTPTPASTPCSRAWA